MADERKTSGGNGEEQAAEPQDELAAQVHEERSIYDRGETEDVVATPPDHSRAEQEVARWREDVRVDPERAREILRPRNAGNEMRGRGGRDVNWRGEDDQWSALFQDEETSRPSEPREEEGTPGERPERAGDRDRLESDREVQRTVSREPEVEGGTRGEPEGLTSSMLRGAVAGALGALALAFASRRAEASPLADDASSTGSIEGVGLTVGFGAMLGAIYGAVQTRWEPPALLHALALSGLSYAATASGDARKADALLAEHTGSGTIGDRLDRGDAHLAFGVTTAAAFDLLR